MSAPTPFIWPGSFPEFCKAPGCGAPIERGFRVCAMPGGGYRHAACEIEGAPPAPSAGDGARTAPTPVPVAGIPVEPAAPAAVAPGHNPAAGKPAPDLDDAA